MTYKIKWFRTIVDENELNVPINSIVTLVGVNGVGKTNFLDAIRHFDIGIKNVKVETTPLHDGSAIQDEEIIYNEDLLEGDIKEISEILLKIEIEGQKNYQKHFAKSDSKMYKYFYKKENGNLTDLAILENKIFEKYKTDVIPLKYINQNDGYYSLKWDLIEKIEELKITIKQKDILKKVINSIKKIEEIFKRKPTIFYIENGTQDNDVIFSNNLNLLKSENNTYIKRLLTFLHPNGIKMCENILNYSTENENDVRTVATIKDKFKLQANRKIKELFEQFDIYAYPEVDFDGLSLEIKVRTKLNYKFNDLDTRNNSSGYKSFLWFILILEIAKTSYGDLGKRVIILADEMDKNLHPILQMQLVDYLEQDINKWKNLSIVWTTHSPFLIPSKQSLKIISYVVDRDLEGRTSIQEYKNISSNNTLSAYTLFASQMINSNVYLSSLPKKDVLFVDDSKDNFNLPKLQERLSDLDIQAKIILASTVKKDKSIDSNKAMKTLKEINDVKEIRSEWNQGRKIMLLDNQYMDQV